MGMEACTSGHPLGLETSEPKNYREISVIFRSAPRGNPKLKRILKKTLRYLERKKIWPHFFLLEMDGVTISHFGRISSCQFLKRFISF